MIAPNNEKPPPGKATAQCVSGNDHRSEAVNLAPPRSEEAEKGVIGSMILNPAMAMTRCAELGLAAHKFYFPQYRVLFVAANDMWDSGRKLDLITFTQFLRDRNLLDSVGGAAAVTELLTFVPTAANLDYYIEIVLAKHSLREGLAVAKTFAEQVAHEPDDNGAALALAAERFAAIHQESKNAGEHRDERARILDERRFDAEKPPPPVTPRFKLLDSSICTPGNLTAIQAQAKGGKTAVVTACLAAAFPEPEGDCLGFSSENPDGLAIIHFDTEQSPADHHAVVLTALRRAEVTTAPLWLRSYRLADLPVIERRKLLYFEIERANKECGGIHSIFLDGGADLMNDPNDTTESFAFVDELHQLAIRYATVILSIIHENPSTEIGKTRGHFGSQLERKAETNLRLAKDKDDGVTTIFAEKARHAHIPKALGPRFVWSEDENMHVSADPKRPAHRTRAFEPGEIIELMNGRELTYMEAFRLCEEKRGWKIGTFKTAWKQLKDDNAIAQSILDRAKWSANGQ